MDVEKALNFDDEFKVRSLGPNAHRLNVSISNSMHIIEPEANDEVGMDFDSGNWTADKSLQFSIRNSREYYLEAHRHIVNVLTSNINILIFLLLFAFLCITGKNG